MESVITYTNIPL